MNLPFLAGQAGGRREVTPGGVGGQGVSIGKQFPKANPNAATGMRKTRGGLGSWVETQIYLFQALHFPFWKWRCTGEW